MADIFKDRNEMPEPMMFPPMAMPMSPLVVRTVMVPSESRDNTPLLINRSVREPMCVEHVERPRFGHKV